MMQTVRKLLQNKQKVSQMQYLYLCVASIKQSNGQPNTFLENLLIFGVHNKVWNQFGGPFPVQPALNGSNDWPVLILTSIQKEEYTRCRKEAARQLQNGIILLIYGKKGSFRDSCITLGHRKYCVPIKFLPLGNLCNYAQIIAHTKN